MRYLIITALLSLLVLPGCKPKDPSVLKIYVRSNNFILTEDALVRIVGDLSKGTPEYFAEARSDASGVAYFELDEYFDSFEKGKDKVAFFTVYAKDSSNTFSSDEARARAHITSTGSITLEE